MVRSCTCLLLCTIASSAAQLPAYQPSAAELANLRERNGELERKIKALEAAGKLPDLIADVAIYEKAAEWLLRYPEEFYARACYADALAGIERGLARADELGRGAPAWTTRKGRISRGYRSRIDDSIQPYGLSIPEAYDSGKPMRLDVFLHGRSPKLTEATFLSAHDGGKPVPPVQQFIQLDVYGRGNNSYFWAGETDVFEALESVRARYNIDPERIVLRGFSMGGTGAWELGLHFPDRWAAVEAGAGYAETRLVVESEISDPLHRALLTIHDAVLCSVNLTNVPWVAYGGELDVQRVSSLRVEDTLKSLGLLTPDLRALFLVGPGVGHRFHPDSQRQSSEFIARALPRRVPAKFRFVAYTPHYGSVWGFHLDTLETLYQRAELKGTQSAVETRNVSVLRIDSPRELTIDGQRLRGSVFEKSEGRWQARAPSGLRKRAGLQGPIDDAFQDSFLCVGDGPALTEFRAKFAKYMRGDIRIKQPAGVTAADIAAYHLVLFGTPWTNPWIAKVLPKLPVRWTTREIEVAGHRSPSAGRRLVLIYPNPLNPQRYVVFNSGHTFTDPEGYDVSSWLLFPRLGDYAVVDDATRKPAFFGVFDSKWGR